MLGFGGIQAKTARNGSQTFPSVTMEVYIDKEVHEELVSFYQASLRNHEALDEATVVNKVNRLYDALDTLGETAEIKQKILSLRLKWNRTIHIRSTPAS